MIVLYVTVLIVWIYILFNIHDADTLGFIILLLPVIYIVCAAVCAVYAPDKGLSVGSAACISISILIAVPLLAWINRDIAPHLKRRYLRLAISAVILALLAQFPLIIPNDYILSQLRGLLECFAITLLCYAVYLVFIEQPHIIFNTQDVPQRISS